MDQVYFTWPDYLVLGIILSLSAAIGFYYACTGGKQRTTKEYLLADRGMHWFPVACSLVASFVSSLTLIGLPGEVYSFGTIILYSFIFKPIGVIISAKFYLPAFRRLGGFSLYKYIELRYGRIIKYMMVGTGMFQGLMFSSLIMYGPALSIAAATGMNIWLAILSVAAVAIIYTVLGGLKAVLWTDTLQLIIMVGGILLVLIYGGVEAGGFAAVWEANRISGRLDLLEPKKFLPLDPRVRHTIWGVAIHGIFVYISIYGTTQTSFQRFMSLRKDKWSLQIVFGITAFLTCLFGVFSALIGLVIFAHNKYCDPLSTGKIFTKDQLYPLYVMQLLGHLPGLPGFVLSAIFSASLSSLSSSMSSLTAVILQEFIKPRRPNMRELTMTIISKFIALGLGCILVALVVLIRNIGVGIFSTALAIGGVLGSPSIAVFTMGIFMPIVNQKGAIIGYIVAVLYGGWMGYGALINRPYIYKYPVTTAGCNITDASQLANISSPVYDPSTWDPQSHYRSGVEGFYDISYTWIGMSGFFVTVIVSVIFSHILVKKDDKLIDKHLLSPYITENCCCMLQSWKDRINFGDSDNTGLEDESESSKDKDSLSVELPEKFSATSI